jgi:ribosomal-protein-alanine N-acetyltransferase
MSMTGKDNPEKVGAEEKLTLRPIEILDLEQVLQIEMASYSSPWRLEDFFREITYNQLARYFLAESGERVAGFVGMWLVIDAYHEHCRIA